MLRVALFVISFLVILVSGAQSARYVQTAQVIISDASGKRLSPSGNVTWAPLSTGNTTTSCAAEKNSICFSVQDSATRYQKIQGVGGSFLRSGAILLNLMSEKQQENILRDLFHPVQGAGFKVAKVPMSATDFMPQSLEDSHLFFTYEDVPGNFSIARELDQNGTINFIRRAQEMAGRRILLQSPIDYVPEWMMNKSSGVPNMTSMISYKINTTMYPTLAQYFLDFAEQFKSHGVPIEYITIFNEPNYVIPGYGTQNFGSYQFIDVDEIAELVVNHVGPLFRSTPGAPKLTWGAQYGRRETWGWAFDDAGQKIKGQNYTAMMMRPDVLPFIDLLAYHGYDCGDYGGWVCTGPEKHNATCPMLEGAIRDLKQVRDALPTIPAMGCTEMCYAVEFNNWPRNTCPKLPLYYFEDSLQWGRMLFGDISVGSGWETYWNFLLDPEGGPFLVSPQHNDPPGNYQHPLVIVDWKNDQYYLTGAYYAFAHFGKFATDHWRLEHQRSPDLVVNADNILSFGVNVYQLVFINEQEAVVNLMNDQLESYTLQLVVDGYTATVTLPPVSFVSVVIPLTSQPPAV